MDIQLEKLQLIEQLMQLEVPETVQLIKEILDLELSKQPSSTSNAFWDALTPLQKQKIQSAILELKSGARITHEDALVQVKNQKNL